MAAAADYRQVVERLPAPEHLVAFGELLEATGQVQDAEEQYAVVRATQQLYAANGQDVDSELALFEADHGDPATAVRLAARAYATRPDSVHVQDAYAWALHAAGRSAEALPIARAAARTGPALPCVRLPPRRRRGGRRRPGGRAPCPRARARPQPDVQPAARSPCAQPCSPGSPG